MVGFGKMMKSIKLRRKKKSTKINSLIAQRNKRNRSKNRLTKNRLRRNKLKEKRKKKLKKRKRRKRSHLPWRKINILMNRKLKLKKHMKKSQKKKRTNKGRKRSQLFFRRDSTSETKQIERNKDICQQVETKVRKKMRGQRTKSQLSTWGGVRTKLTWKSQRMSSWSKKVIILMCQRGSDFFYEISLKLNIYILMAI